ncbi:MAG: hypothetical protein IJI27_01920, partial [Oscillospiraceae bacterium]|nr:hypothetical protein [Oscillospiraceae bacterium]
IVKKRELLRRIRTAKGLITFRLYRNKRKAHIDLDAAFEMKVPMISTDEIKNLLFELREIISLTFEYLFSTPMNEHNYEEAKEKYIESLQKCIN